MQSQYQNGKQRNVGNSEQTISRNDSAKTPRRDNSFESEDFS